MNTIADRLRALLEKKDWTPYRLSLETKADGSAGVPQPTIARILGGESQVPKKPTVEKLAAALGVSYSYLYDGIEDQEPQFKKNNDGVHPSKIMGAEEWDDDTPLRKDEVAVPLLKETRVSGGDGSVQSVVEVSTRRLRFAKSSLRSSGVQEKDVVCVPVSGNSMERQIMNGSTVWVDVSKTSVIDGEIYAIDHDGWLRVKYLYRMPGGGLRVHSENSEEHPDELYGPDWHQRIRVIGWVFGWSTIRRWKGA